MDLISLVFSLRLAADLAPGSPLPRWWGRAAHALVLNTVRQVDEGLAASLHDSTNEEDLNSPANHNHLRPFTTSTLMGRFSKGALDPAQVYLLRLTAFRADLAGILLTASQGGSLSPGQAIELDYCPFEILSVQPAPVGTGQAGLPGSNPVSPWAASGSYQELSAPYLLSKIPAPRRISLQFTSPTTFKSAGRHNPLPLPALVFGSLLERWNAFAPISFPAEVRRYADECLVISKYDLQTRSVPTKSRGLRVGCVGSISYATLNYDRYWMSLLAVLAEFSLFSGVGAGTTAGMGQCRRMEDKTTQMQD